MKSAPLPSSDYVNIDQFAQTSPEPVEPGRVDQPATESDYAEPWEFKQLDPRAQKALEEGRLLPRGLAALPARSRNVLRESGVYATVGPRTEISSSGPHKPKRQGAIRKPALPARRYDPSEVDGGGQG